MKYKCRDCEEEFDARRHYNIHRSLQHSANLQPWPWDNDWEDRPREVLENHAETIRGGKRTRGQFRTDYNYPSDDMSGGWQEIADHVREIYRDQEQSFKLNFSIGVVLRNTETGELRYFTPYVNNQILKTPFLVTSPGSVKKLIDHLKEKDLRETIKNLRPNSAWVPTFLANLHFFVYPTNYVLGYSSQLPDYINKNNLIVGLSVDPFNRKKKYVDNRCLFRCLALHRGAKDFKSLENDAELYVLDFEKETSTCEFQLSHACSFEKLFKVNLKIYQLMPSGSVRKIYSSLEDKFDDTLYVNMHGSRDKIKHLSYIKRPEILLRFFQCTYCEKQFSKESVMKNHQKVCSRSTKLILKNEIYSPNKTIMEELYEMGIISEFKYYPYFAFFDIECMLEKYEDTRGNDAQLKFTRKHIPISISIDTNVPNFEVECFVESDLDTLVSYFVDYIELLQEKAEEHLIYDWKKIEKELNDYVNRFKFDDDEKNKKIMALKKRFEEYRRQLPVLSFNGSRYDLLSLFEVLPKFLGLQHEGFVIKKENSYLCISCEKFKFLDIIHFLAPGTNYASFLKAYSSSEEKGVFPYSWFSSVEKLEATSLPSHEDFFNDLKNCNITEEEYAEAQRVWDEENMETFRDYLIFYNNRDTFPAVKAIESMLKFYRNDLELDLFKVGISAPGIARKLLFKSCNAFFTCLGDLETYKTFKASIIGGPSIIFHRYMKVGDNVRGVPDNPCKNIQGLDANSLYLSSFEQEMPTGFYIKRKEPDFKPHILTKTMDMYSWLDALEEVEGPIQHKLNAGYEQKIGPYFVDGFQAPNRCWEFLGCWWHGCEKEGCQKKSEEQRKRYERTINREKYLRDRGFEVNSIWECEFKNWRVDKTKYLTTFTKFHPNGLTQAEIIHYVRMNKIFGAVECNIHVPQHLYQKFAEMSPIFSTCDVPFDKIGKTMQRHVIDNDLSQKPKRLLVGGMKGEKILLITPLLRWYMQHGLIVTRVYQLFEFEPKVCFAGFVKTITDARRKGDIDPSQAIVGDTMKLLGNSGYGSCIMDKEKHRDVLYEDEECKILQKINEPQFVHLTELDDLVEIERKNKKIKMNVPVQIGFTVLQYAKLHMLSFYYDCVELYVPRNSFQYLEMDTDSAYMALTKESLMDFIPEAVKESWGHEPHKFFPRECCDEHKKYDRRKPGLMKQEISSAQEMICLCSKTYAVQKASGEIKFSAKGVQSSRVENAKKDMLNVLKTQKAIRKTNIGFRYKDKRMFTYTQEKKAFSWEYWKRLVHPDGITTSPLDLVLTPWKKYEGIHVKDDHYLSPAFEVDLLYRGNVFGSALSLCEYIIAEKDGKRDRLVEIVRNDCFTSKWTVEEWSENLELAVEECISVKHKTVPDCYSAGNDIYYINSHKILGCGFTEEVHFMFPPLEYTGRNFYGERLKKHFATLLK